MGGLGVAQGLAQALQHIGTASQCLLERRLHPVHHFGVEARACHLYEQPPANGLFHEAGPDRPRVAAGQQAVASTPGKASDGQEHEHSQMKA